ncbi:MAG: hypothetical protein RIQ62_1646 [Bacteroidota bacterium]
MKIMSHISPIRFVAASIFLLLPTSAIMMFIFWNSTQYFTFLEDQWFSQTLYFSSGLFLSYFIAQFRFRFLPLFASLVLCFYFLHNRIENFAIGEVDSFFIALRFRIFAILFSMGWLCGWGFQRIRFFAFLFAGIVLGTCIFLMAKTGDLFSVEKLIRYLAPLSVYSLYVVYTHEALSQYQSTDKNFWWSFGKRLVGLLSTLLLLFGAIVWLLYPEIKAKVAEFGGGAKEGDNAMMKQNKDGSMENKKSMGMGGSNGHKNPEPLFCAHIDNYFPGTELPNPLYLTCWHFSSFDTLTETFERDTTLDFSDEFSPDVAQIPLFATRSDSSKIANSYSNKHRKTIDIEIYKKRLSASSFIAPSIAFWVQPITVEKDFQQEFKYAYRAKSYVSDLNSAYFVYNSEDPTIRGFQETRFQELRKAKSYEQTNRRFYQYYTFFPSSPTYSKIKNLADSIARGKHTVIDKVIGVRDYFLQRNEIGQRIFTYTDNPGVPGLPGASRLMYFLFESKKGYCAYYAGATLFLLRAMGIPSRIVTGFLTVDRSDKNKGWYWYYEDQSHGWVQVYFPEYGWIDFDTTVGNEETQHAPTPDGTPPMQPPKPVIAIGAKVLSVDTLRKISTIRISNLIFKDFEFTSRQDTLSIDIQSTRIWKDSSLISIRQLQPNQSVMAVSYDNSLLSLPATHSFEKLYTSLPKPLAIDELYVREKKEAAKNIASKKQSNTPITWKDILYWTALLLSILFVLALATPYAVFCYYRWRSRGTKNTKQKAYYTYRGLLFYLHQMGVQPQGLTILQFARQGIDPLYQISFEVFMNQYLSLKYAGSASNQADYFHQNHLDIWVQKINEKTPFKKRFFCFLNLNTFIQFYFSPTNEI